MKKIIVITALLLSSFSFAQDKKATKEQLTPEQQTELQVKKMTLDLDLTTDQQKEIQPILLKKALLRQEKRAAFQQHDKKRTATEKFDMKNNQLDAQIEWKAQMKKILTPEQFAKWETKHEKNTKRAALKSMKKRKNGKAPLKTSK